MFNSIQDLTVFMTALYETIPSSIVAAFSLVMVLIIGKYLLRLIRDN